MLSRRKFLVAGVGAAVAVPSIAAVVPTDAVKVMLPGNFPQALKKRIPKLVSQSASRAVATGGFPKVLGLIKAYKACWEEEHGVTQPNIFL